MDETNSVVWKLELPAPNGQDYFTEIPAGSQLLGFGETAGKFFVWVRVNPNEPALVAVRFMIVGTGWELTNIPGYYLGTTKMERGDLVWHCFWEDAA